MTEAELLQLIEQAAREGWTELDLNRKGLTSLPGEIRQLQKLTALYLRYNSLNTLPVEIGQLRNLTALDLCFNHLTILPAEIGQLPNLTTLDLSSNRLSNLPIEIGQLKNLAALYLSYNLLRTLPVEVGQLQNLTRLFLNSNHLNVLPTEIGQLQNLTKLYLRSNRLSILPVGIGQLENLTELDLSDNFLSTLPKEIGRLKNLTALNLRSNRLNTLPIEIGQLESLTEFDLHSNQLRTLPTEIGQLQKLEELYLSNNSLNDLPTEIGQLQSLVIVDLGYNQLKALPMKVGQLQNLTSLDLSGNPLELPPPEIVEKGIWAIKKYLRQLETSGKDFLCEAKLLIIGEPGAGKTSLSKKIENPDYLLQEDESSTEGIEVTQWRFPLPDGKEFRVNIWDFGGQEIYHATHQFFLTRRSLYILVADTRKEDTDFYYWLNVVELLSDNSLLLIIKNEKQDRKREINDRQLRGQFTNLKDILATNLKDNRGLPEILKAIQHHISTLPHVGSELPKTWVEVRKALEQDSRNYISLEAYLTICQQHGFTRHEDKLQLSGYLHDLGVCLHFQEDDLLQKTIILKPTWGTAAVYKVLDNPQVIQNLGRFTRTDLATIWHEDQYVTMRPELLKLMMNFKLCYEIPGAPGTYIAPQLLTENQPVYDWESDHNLMLRYEYEFMPKGILTRLIVETHALIEAQSHVWRSGVVLKQDQARAEVIEHYRYHKGEIRVRVMGQHQKELLTIVRHELKQIHDSYGDRLKFTELVPCNCATCNNSQTPHFYRLADLNRRLDNKRYQVECEQSYEFVDIHSLIDEVITSYPNQNSSSYPSSFMAERNQVFISYSHNDQEWLAQLQKHLKPMIRNQTLNVWDDTQIQPGAKWRDEIATALAAAKIAVLMVSPDFLASDFIAENELPPLLDAAEAEGLIIIWIPLSYCLYEETEIEKYQAAYPPNQPLDSLSVTDQNRAWIKICKTIKTAANL
jgi:Leucine-rich repeat (LRR) protein